MSRGKDRSKDWEKIKHKYHEYRQRHTRRTSDNIWPRDTERYEAMVIKVIDGDTVDLFVRVGFNVGVEERFRLVGIDAPEVRGKEREAGLKAKSFLEEVLPVGSTVWVESRKADSFGRWLGNIFFNSKFTDLEKSASDLLLESGHAEKYDDD